MDAVGCPINRRIAQFRIVKGKWNLSGSSRNKTQRLTAHCGAQDAARNPSPGHPLQPVQIIQRLSLTGTAHFRGRPQGPAHRGPLRPAKKRTAQISRQLHAAHSCRFAVRHAWNRRGNTWRDATRAAMRTAIHPPRILTRMTGKTGKSNSCRPQVHASPRFRRWFAGRCHPAASNLPEASSLISPPQRRRFPAGPRPPTMPSSWSQIAPCPPATESG